MNRAQIRLHNGVAPWAFLRLVVLGFATFAVQLPAAPRIGSSSLRNGASFAFITPGGGGIAPGSIFVIFGADLGPETPLSGTLPYEVSLPAGSTGTSVEFRSTESGATVSAYLLYTSASQVMGILPSSMPAGAAEYTVSYQGASSDPQAVNILPRSVGIFTQSMTGFGPGVIQNVVSESEQPLNQLTRPALPGQYIVLWATGLGAIDQPDNVAPPVGNVGDQVEVEIGGTRLPASYAGRAPGFPGVDQINVRIPEDAGLDSCYVGGRVWTGDRPSQDVVLSAAAAPEPCKHPYGLSPETLARLDAGGTVAFGQFQMSRFVQEFAPQPWFDSDPQNYGNVSGAFYSMKAADLAGFSYPWFGEGQDQKLGCHAVENGLIGGIWYNDGDFFQPSQTQVISLDAGDSIGLMGPAGKHEELTPPPLSNDSQTNFGYAIRKPNPDGSCCTEALPGDFLERGEWVLEGTGGADVGPFRAVVQLPAFLEVALPRTVNREQDVDLTWPADGFGESDRVQIGIGSPVVTEMNGQVQYTSASQVMCRAVASSGHITVPASLMRERLTATGEYPGTWYASVIRPASDAAVFSAPGIEYGAVLFNSGEFRPVDIQ